MPDTSAPNPLSELCRVHEYVTKYGFALTTEGAIGLPPKCSTNLQGTYFDGGLLKHDDGDKPDDRERARDVIYYEWNDGKLSLEEYETIAIWDRSEIEGERIHTRIELLEDPQVRELIETFLSLVPEERRRPRGTFGVNLFRTHTNVVSKPHQDEEEFIILYVLDREGDGAESYLYKYDEQAGAGEIGEQVLRQQLNSGELMIFEDRRFKHGATDLVPPPGGRAKRDVLVCTIDYPTTYLERQPVSSGTAWRLPERCDIGAAESARTILCHAKFLSFLVDTRTLETAVTGDLIGISGACDSGDHGGRWRASRLTPSAH